jgi:pimeloyl-ACP methyl ester carboxylesterase
MSASSLPLYFDGCHGRLYGVHHQPEPAVDRSHGILFLPPLGQEYKRCHKPLQKLAQDLSRAGFHVLRFDYAGSGDSADLPDWSLDTWRQDGRDALEQLQARSGARALSAFGIRLGAGVAVALDRPLAHLVLWDPIGSGAAYLEELEQLNHDLLNRYRHSFRSGNTVRIPSDQLLGHRFPASMRRSLGGWSLDVAGGPPAREALWIETETTPATADPAQLSGLLAEAENRRHVEARCKWRSLAEIENIIMGQPVTRQVLLHFKEASGDPGNGA